MQVSSDAGHYVCDYLYYGSLARLHHEGNEKRPWQGRMTVVFLHVPYVSGAEAIEKGRDVTVALIRALVDSRRARADDYD